MPDITTIRGDTRVVAIPVFDADLDQYATLQDVDEIQYVVSENPTPDTVLLELTDDSQRVEITTADTIDTVELDSLDPSTSVIRVELEPQETADFEATTLHHECQLTDIAGNVTTVMRGDFEVQASATNVN